MILHLIILAGIFIRPSVFEKITDQQNTTDKMQKQNISWNRKEIPDDVKLIAKEIKPATAKTILITLIFFFDENNFLIKIPSFCFEPIIA